MRLKDLSTRELIQRLAGIADEVRITPSHLPDGVGGVRLNPQFEELARQELEVLRALRIRRQVRSGPLHRLLAGRVL